VTGYVDSLFPFYKTAHVVVCPLRIGGGIKLKILEALSAGKAIVSTSIGAQGLDLMSHKPVIIADEVSDFAKKVVWLLLNPKERHRQEEEALGYAANIPNWDEVSEVLAKCYNEMIASRQMR
jgi:glycosyltransferase involved in cell wall biosynthesis